MSLMFRAPGALGRRSIRSLRVVSGESDARSPAQADLENAAAERERSTLRCVPPAIRCRNVGYVYPDGTRAVEGVDLEIRAGELFCLLGPNGAGKTTFIRTLTTELRPRTGSVEIAGCDAHARPLETKRRLGVIPQSVALFADLTVEQHLACFAPLKGIARRDARRAAQRVTQECELDSLLRKRASQLSGGQQRRVLLALALLGDPALLVLDEPTVGLDPSARRLVWSTIERQRASDKTILLTTHYLDEAERLADRIGFMQQSRLTRVGNLPELYASVGKTVRATRVDPETGDVRENRLFDTLADAQRFVRERGWTHYSVGRVSLEDIYLELTRAGDGAPLH